MDGNRGRVLIIGAGGVARVVAHKCCQNSEVFSEILIASRTLSRCDALAVELNTAFGGRNGPKTAIGTAQVDADDRGQLTELMKRYMPDVVIHVALPYQDLTIMDACLEAGCD